MAAVPLLAALAALLAAFLTGFDGRTPLPAPVEDRFYGFFLDRYPLFAFALVYALARVVAAAASPGPASAWRRIAGAVVGLGLILAACLHPTFGGLTLRGGFIIGGTAFSNQTPMPAAYAIGAAVSTLILGTAIGIGALLSGGGPARTRVGWKRGLVRAGLGTTARFLTLWFALALIGQAHALNFGEWPRRPLTPGDALIAAGCITVAFLPHAALVLRHERRPGAELA